MSKKIREEVERSLREMLEHLGDDERLGTQLSLAGQLGVGRTTVWRALRRLLDEGVAVIGPRGGVFKAGDSRPTRPRRRTPQPGLRRDGTRRASEAELRGAYLRLVLEAMAWTGSARPLELGERARERYRELSRRDVAHAMRLLRGGRARLGSVEVLPPELPWQAERDIVFALSLPDEFDRDPADGEEASEVVAALLRIWAASAEETSDAYWETALERGPREPAT